MREREKKRGRKRERAEGGINNESYRASSLMRLAHISKNSMVWLPGRGYGSPPVESTEEVSEEASEPSRPWAWDTGGVEGAEASPSTTSPFSVLSFFRAIL